MDKEKILYFDENDASEIGTNGKQVFFAKKINGKVSYNKTTEKKKEKQQNDFDPYDDIIIGINNKSYLEKKKREMEQEKKKSKMQKKEVSSKNKKNQPKNSNKKSKKKKKKKLKTFIKILALILVIAGITVFAMISPIFNITEINVSGNEKLSENTIISLSGLSKGENIFRNLKSNITSNIKQNPYVENVTVKRVLPGTIEIQIEEREIAYQVKVINSYVYIDYQGYILENSSEKENVPTIEGLSTQDEEFLNNKRVNNEDISNLNTILRIMENAKNVDISDKITNITIQDGKQYILYLEEEEKYIYLGDETNLNNKMLYIQIILENEKGNAGTIFINGDLNNGFEPYFREGRD